MLFIEFDFGKLFMNIKKTMGLELSLGGPQK